MFALNLPAFEAKIAQRVFVKSAKNKFFLYPADIFRIVYQPLYCHDQTSDIKLSDGIFIPSVHIAANPYNIAPGCDHIRIQDNLPCPGTIQIAGDIHGWIIHQHMQSSDQKIYQISQFCGRSNLEYVS